jgi:hypothetical protein
MPEAHSRMPLDYSKEAFGIQILFKLPETLG